MTSKKQLQISMTNVGPHRGQTLSFQPGVNVLRGRNGVGKSTFIAGAVTALGGSERVSVTDGALKGQVAVDGVVTLTLGRKTLQSGAPSVELGAYAAVGDVIDPGIIDPKKADAHRVRAVLTMAPVAVTPELIATLTDGDVGLAPEGALNVLEVGEHIRKTANEQALAQERVVTEALARVKAEQERVDALGEEVPGAPSVEDAERIERDARRTHSETLLLAKQRAETEERMEEIRRTRGDRPDVKAAGSAFDAAASKRESVMENCDAARKEVAAILVRARDDLLEAQINAKTAEDRLRAHEAATKVAIAEADQKLAAERKRLDESVRAAQRWDEQDALLKKPVSGPDARAVTEADVRVAASDTALQSARREHARRESMAVIGRSLAEAEVSEKRGKTLRAVAHGVSERLGAVLAANGIAGLEIEEGRLFATLNGKRQLFADRLSFGQRARIALDIALKSFKHRMIPLKPEFWAALDPATQKEFAKMAREMDVIVLTEAPSDDDGIVVGLVE